MGIQYSFWCLSEKFLSESKGFGVKSEKLFYMAGPCAIENYSMMERITKFLLSYGITVMRAGAFKPRIICSSFQGLGLQGLEKRSACYR